MVCEIVSYHFANVAFTTRSRSAIRDFVSHHQAVALSREVEGGENARRPLSHSRSRTGQPAATRQNARKHQSAEMLRLLSGRNQLTGRIVELKIEGLLAQVKLSIGGQIITSIITAEAAREMRLKVGETAAALIKSTEVMVLRV